MPYDLDIQDAAVTVITAAIASIPCDGRKQLVLAESEEVPRIMVNCEYVRGDVGDSDFPINGFYTLTIRTLARNNQLRGGNETLKEWRQIIMRAFYGPTLTGVDAVSDMRAIKPRLVSKPQTPPGVDSEFIQFEVETYEGLT